LEKLGYRVYHGSVAVRCWEKKHLDLWEEALKAKFLGGGKRWDGDELDKILQNYTVCKPPYRYILQTDLGSGNCTYAGLQAIEDIPCILFVDELLERFPDAKVVLTNRDVDSWEMSLRNTIFKIMKWKTLSFIAWLNPVKFPALYEGMPH
jgi:hypothetical protein